MAAPVLLRHPSSLEHDTGAHPERAARIVAIERALEARDWLGLGACASRRAADARRCSRRCTRARYVRCDRAVLRGGRRRRSTPTPSPRRGSYEAALHAAGGAVALVDALLDGDAPVGASLHRPPGHHAEAARAMGFCLFNNVAVAARHALDAPRRSSAC